MKRLCITINFFPISGGARAIVSELWRVLHREYDIHFLTIPPSDFSGPYRIHRLQKARRHYVPCNPGIFPLNFCYMLWGIIRLVVLNKRFRFDAILAQDGVFTGFYSAIAGRLTNTRVVILDYGATTNYLSSAYWNFGFATGTRLRKAFLGLHTLLLRSAALMTIRITIRMADRFAVLGYELAEIYNRLRVPKSRIGNIQYSIDENFFSPSRRERIIRKIELGIPRDSVVVNATCRLSQEKGIEYLMPALMQAIQRNDRIFGLVVGAGNMYNFASSFVIENHLERKIILIGDASASKVRDLLQISDIFVYAGVIGSNVSLAVLEAMATKCAVIATNSPKSHENLLAGGRGVVIPVRDTAAIVRAILLLAKDAALRKKIGDIAREWVIRNHSSSALKETVQSLLVL